MERDDLKRRDIVREESSTFSRHNLGEQYDDAESVAAMCRDLLAAHAKQPVRAIELGGSSFSLEACRALSNALAQVTSLDTVLLDDLFTRRKIPEIHPALGLFSTALLNADHLTWLDLSDNALNPGGAKAIEPLIANCLSMKTLVLNNTGVGPWGGKTIGDALFQAHVNGKERGTPYRLETFILGRSRLEQDGCLAVAKAFKAISTLREIRINNNGIFVDSIVEFAKALSYNRDLEILELSDNSVKARGGKALAKALHNLPKFRVLIASDCLLKDKGGLPLLQALSDCDNLEYVDLDYNDMSPKAVDLIVSGISNKGRLVKVQVNGNEFGPSGKRRLQQAFGGKLGSMEDNSPSEDDEDDEATEDEDESDEEPDQPGDEEGFAPADHAPSTAASAQDVSDVANVLAGMGVNSIEARAQRLVEANDVVALVALAESAASDTADFAAVLRYAAQGSLMTNMANELLAHLGIIKGEEQRKKQHVNAAKAIALWTAIEAAAKQGAVPPPMARIMSTLADDKALEERAHGKELYGTVKSGPYLKGTELDSARQRAVAALKKHAQQ